jgi:glucose-6-phosphate-specific signal transduction histidine kinase
VAKHAQATQAEVTVTRHGDVLRIAVTDDGSGGAVPADSRTWPSSMSGCRPRTPTKGSGPRWSSKYVTNVFAKLDLPPTGIDHRRVLAVLKNLGT